MNLAKRIGTVPPGRKYENYMQQYCSTCCLPYKTDDTSNPICPVCLVESLKSLNSQQSNLCVLCQSNLAADGCAVCDVCNFEMELEAIQELE